MFHTQTGWPTSSWCRRRTRLDACVLTTPTSTRHAPKDPFLLPRMDKMIDFTVGCERLSFMDAYSGYHQIQMKRPARRWLPSPHHTDPSATSQCPSGLKNAGATYQRTMHTRSLSLVLSQTVLNSTKFVEKKYQHVQYPINNLMKTYFITDIVILLW